MLHAIKKSTNIFKRFSDQSEVFHFIFGLVATLGVTLAEVLKWKQRIYFVYNNATRDYWNGLNPYDIHWAGTRAPDEYLYGPLFNFLFLPISLMPEWIGPFVWNFFSYGIFFYAVFSLPQQFDIKKKKAFWLYLLPLLLNNLMYNQFNVLVAAIFLLAFTAMETRGVLAAAALIAFSALTKVYGGFQYLLSLLYKKPFRWGFTYAFPIFLLLFLLPALHDGPDGLILVYKHWFEGITRHADTRTWQSVFYVKLFFSSPPDNKNLYQLITGLCVVALILLGMRKKDSFEIRAGLFAILLGWMILFSAAPEISTYLIALAGYLVWFFSSSRGSLHQVLFWLNFCLLVFVPQDVLCPKPIMRFLVLDMHLNIIVFSITWFVMVCSIFKSILFNKKP